jgi:hypothetical protein
MTIAQISDAVIASAAKQSIFLRALAGLLRYARNDEKGVVA